jgi:hypothetical protein
VRWLLPTSLPPDLPREWSYKTSERVSTEAGAVEPPRTTNEKLEGEAFEWLKLVDG